MNHHHERELTHLVAEHDRLEQAGELKQAESVARRIFMHYGYRVVRCRDHGFGRPKLIKA